MFLQRNESPLVLSYTNYSFFVSPHCVFLISKRNPRREIDMASCKVQLNRRSSQYGADEQRKDGIPSTTGVNLRNKFLRFDYARFLRSTNQRK